VDLERLSDKVHRAEPVVKTPDPGLRQRLLEKPHDQVLLQRAVDHRARQLGDLRRVREVVVDLVPVLLRGAPTDDVTAGPRPRVQPWKRLRRRMLGQSIRLERVQYARSVCVEKAVWNRLRSRLQPGGANLFSPVTGEMRDTRRMEHMERMAAWPHSRRVEASKRRSVEGLSAVHRAAFVPEQQIPGPRRCLGRRP
jgi:hypothetical protein